MADGIETLESESFTCKEIGLTRQTQQRNASAGISCCSEGGMEDRGEAGQDQQD